MKLQGPLSGLVGTAEESGIKLMPGCPTCYSFWIISPWGAGFPRAGGRWGWGEPHLLFPFFPV